MKKGLRPFSAKIANDMTHFIRSKPRPDEEGIETRIVAGSGTGAGGLVPNLDLMKKGLRLSVLKSSVEKLDSSLFQT